MAVGKNLEIAEEYRKTQYFGSELQTILSLGCQLAEKEQKLEHGSDRPKSSSVEERYSLILFIGVDHSTCCNLGPRIF
jgi:hypothetical protein